MGDSTQPSGLMRMKDAAAELAVSVRTLYRMIADGMLPQPVKVRGGSRMPREAIEQFIRRQRGGQ